ncbi:MAG: hypothetical protein LBR79_05330 [Oscillospiraceae bacterium]|nr:hypothetical protein [Oscillospiraceae bacterium]
MAVRFQMIFYYISVKNLPIFMVKIRLWLKSADNIFSPGRRRGERKSSDCFET